MNHSEVLRSETYPQQVVSDLKAKWSETRPIRYEKRSEIPGLQWKQKAYPIRFSFRNVTERLLSGIVETCGLNKLMILNYLSLLKRGRYQQLLLSHCFEKLLTSEKIDYHFEFFFLPNKRLRVSEYVSQV